MARETLKLDSTGRANVRDAIGAWLTRLCLIFAVPLAIAESCPVTVYANAWSWGADGGDLFWMWYWLAFFTLVIVGSAWMGGSVTQVSEIATEEENS